MFKKTDMLFYYKHIMLQPLPRMKQPASCARGTCLLPAQSPSEIRAGGRQKGDRHSLRDFQETARAENMHALRLFLLGVSEKRRLVLWRCPQRAWDAQFPGQ